MRLSKIPGHIAGSSVRISHEALKLALEESGIEFLAVVPDSDFELLLQSLLTKGTPIKLIQLSRESEGMSICSGLAYGGKKAALLCSYKGFYNSVDSLLGVAYRTQSSFLILISEAALPVEETARDLEHGRHSAALLEVFRMPYYDVKRTEELSLIKEAVARTEDETQPLAVILRW
jgi:sulfopyruvate decarboxylase TPP-binding subunit